MAIGGGAAVGATVEVATGTGVGVAASARAGDAAGCAQRSVRARSRGGYGRGSCKGQWWPLLETPVLPAAGDQVNQR